LATITSLIPVDKLVHLLVGIVIAMIVTPLAGPVAGVAGALAIGAFKEWVIDAWMKLGTFEVNDFYATAVGGIAGSSVSYLVQLTGRIV